MRDWADEDSESPGGSQRLSMVVMCHPRRAESAGRLAARLGRGTEQVFDPEPDAAPSALRTAARAWARCDGTSTHHAVVQDDIEPTANLWPLMENAIRTHPSTVLTFYANSTSWNGASARAAVLTGHTWVPPVPGEYFPTLATVMPCPLAHDFAELAAAHLSRQETDDDEVLADFLADRGVPALLRCPNLVEHRDLPSLSGWDADPRRPDMFGGVRRSVCFQPRTHLPTVESVLASPPAWAQFNQRRALLRMPSLLGRTRWQTQSRAAQLKVLGISGARLQHLSDAWFEQLPSLPERRGAVRLLIRELYLAGYGLGWVVAGVRPGAPEPPGHSPANDAALSTLVESGLAKDAAVLRWREHWDALTEIVWAAFHEGYRADGAGARTERDVPVEASTR
jgi:hypothetical protein